MTEKKCIPCMSFIPPMKEDKAREMLLQVKDWELKENGKKLERTFRFRDFNGSMAFVDKVAKIAESEGHHPDIFISYRDVTLMLFTHKIGGLHENDFILAAKINQLQ